MNDQNVCKPLFRQSWRSLLVLWEINKKQTWTQLQRRLATSTTAHTQWEHYTFCFLPSSISSLFIRWYHDRDGWGREQWIQKVSMNEQTQTRELPLFLHLANKTSCTIALITILSHWIKAIINGQNTAKMIINAIDFLDHSMHNCCV